MKSIIWNEKNNQAILAEYSSSEGKHVLEGTFGSVPALKSEKEKRISDDESKRTIEIDIFTPLSIIDDL
jgi:hypothetical protein